MNIAYLLWQIYVFIYITAVCREQSVQTRLVAERLFETHSNTCTLVLCSLGARGFHNSLPVYHILGEDCDEMRRMMMMVKTKRTLV